MSLKSDEIIDVEPVARKIGLPDVRVESCGMCGCAQFSSDGASAGECHFKAPEMLIVPIQSGVQPNRLGSQVFSAWPPIMRNQFCIEGFRPKFRQ